MVGSKPGTVSGKKAVAGFGKGLVSEVAVQTAKSIDEVMDASLGSSSPNLPMNQPTQTAVPENTAEEISKIRSEIDNSKAKRNVEQEMAKERQGRKQRDRQREDVFLRQLAEERQKEEMEANQDAGGLFATTKAKKGKGTAFLRGKKKTKGTGEIARKKH